MRVVEVVVAAVLASGCTHYAASAIGDSVPEHSNPCTIFEQCGQGGGSMGTPVAVAVGSAVAGVFALALIRHITGDD